MRLVIDATPLLLRSAGVKNYVYYWLTSLRRKAGDEAIGTFPFWGGIGPLQHERSMVGRLRTVAGLAMLQGLNASRVPWTVPGIDVFHTSHHLHNPPRGTKVTTTIHDMTCWLTPELHSRANVKLTLWFGEHILKRADGIIAVSESTRRDAIDILDLDPGRITTIHPGVADSYFDVKADEVHAVRERLALGKPYVLYVGTIEPRKNIPALLDAWDDLDADLRAEFELVIAGPVGWADKQTIARLRAPRDDVRYLGYVSEANLPGLTAGATALAYPSLYEGFGFPVAQAMAAGVPVVTSDLSSLPEVAGEAAILIDPQSTEELRDGLTRLLRSPEMRIRLGGAGRRRAREFRWDVSARKSLDWFQSL